MKTRFSLPISLTLLLLALASVGTANVAQYVAGYYITVQDARHFADRDQMLSLMMSMDACASGFFAGRASVWEQMAEASY